MDLKNSLLVLRRTWTLIAGLAVAGILVAGCVAFFTKPTYHATAQLFVGIQSSGSVQELQQGNSFSQARVQSYVKTVSSEIVLEPVVQRLGLSETAEQLARRVTATSPPSTVLIDIRVADSSPTQAAATAQAIAESLIDVVQRLEVQEGAETARLGVTITNSAKVPAAASAPNVPLYLTFGLLAGLAFGVGTAVLRAVLDNRIRREEDLRLVTDLPVLGAIPYSQEAKQSPLLKESASYSPRSESFRQLRTNLQFANVSGQAEVVAVTSSLPGEGKTSTASNLAVSLAQAGQKVCLVDADLRRPMVHEYFGLDRSLGLTTVLVGGAAVDDVLHPWGEDDLFILPSGQIPPNPSELLGSDKMKLLIKSLKESFDTVILDTPPLLPVTDVTVLVQHVGGIILVVGSERTRRNQLEKALESLSLVGAPVVGVVLNLLPIRTADLYAYGFRAEDLPSRQRAAKAGRSRRRNGGRTREGRTEGEV